MGGNEGGRALGHPYLEVPHSDVRAEVVQVDSSLAENLLFHLCTPNDDADLSLGSSLLLLNREVPDRSLPYGILQPFHPLLLAEADGRPRKPTVIGSCFVRRWGLIGLLGVLSMVESRTSSLCDSLPLVNDNVVGGDVLYNALKVNIHRDSKNPNEGFWLLMLLLAVLYLWTGWKGYVGHEMFLMGEAEIIL